MTKTREVYYRIKPYYLIVHPRSGNSAAYDRKYKMMFEGASPKLIDFAARNYSQVTVGIKSLLTEQQPAWMLPGMESECTGYHLYNDASSTHYIGEIPEG